MQTTTSTRSIHLIIVLLSATTAFAQSLTFERHDETVRGQPLYTTVGDVNGDGIPDLAVLSSDIFGDTWVNIRIGRGDGTFRPSDTTHSIGNAYQITLGDFHGNRYLDYAFGKRGPGEAGIDGVLLYKGDGSGFFDLDKFFETAPNYGPISSVAADFNGDGLTDLAVGFGTHTVVVYLATGDAAVLRPVQTVRVGPDIGLLRYLAVADLDGDGIPDLLSADFTNSIQCIAVLRGNGDGTFRDPQHFDAGAGCQSIAVADVNGDGLLDIAVANFGTEDRPSGGTTVALLIGNGDGTFQPPQFIDGFSSPSSVAWADFRGIGIQDLVVANWGTQSIAILPGNGDGTFGEPQTVSVGRNPRKLSIFDFNGDGLLDIAVPNEGSRSLSILLNTIRED